MPHAALAGVRGGGREVIVDAHTHVSTVWFEPVEVLLFQLDRNQVDRAVLVQFSGYHDNGYLLRCARRHPDRLTAAVGLDATDPGAVADLERFARAGAVGLRINPTSRSPGPDPYAIWRACERLGLTATCYGSADDFTAAAFGAVLREVPGLTVVVEHLGDLRQAGRYLTVERAESLCRALEPFRTVSVKFHGLGELSARAARIGRSAYADPSAAVLLRAYDVLGAGRLMWGSGFPSASSREGYTNTYRHPLAALREHGVTPAEEALMFCHNALAAFGPRR